MKFQLAAVVVLGLLLGAPTAVRADGRPASLSFENWVFWFHSNREWIDPPRVLSDAVNARVEADVLPTVLWATDPSHAGHQAIEGAAYIALGKLAKDVEHVTHLERALDKTLKLDLIVQESAALGLGLLRRTDPARQFGAKTLDRVRSTLFTVFADDGYQARTRGMAALSIGLLADQPTAEGQARATTDRLFELLRPKYGNQDLPVSLLVAIGLQDPSSLTEAHVTLLRDAATKGRLFERDLTNLARAYAAHSLGQVGPSDAAEVLSRMLGGRRLDRNVVRCVAVALGTLATRTDPETRAAVQKSLRERVLGPRRLKDTSARNLATMSLARAVVADVESDTAESAGTKRSLRTLLDIAGKEGRYVDRPYAAIGLALIVRAFPVDSDGVGAWVRERTNVVLRDGLDSKKNNARGQAAFAIALGLCGDTESLGALRAIIGDRKHDHALRGYAAAALGYLGANGAATRHVIRSAHRERASEETRILTMSALGLLRDEEAAPQLLEELRNARSQSVKGQAVVSLAQLGDPASVDPLVAIVRSGREQDLTRMIAVAGLGRLCDPEPRPSLGRITGHTNYRLMTDLMNTVFGTL